MQPPSHPEGKSTEDGMGMAFSLSRMMDDERCWQIHWLQTMGISIIKHMTIFDRETHVKPLKWKKVQGPGPKDAWNLEGIGSDISKFEFLKF